MSFAVVRAVGLHAARCWLVISKSIVKSSTININQACIMTLHVFRYRRQDRVQGRVGFHEMRRLYDF